MMFLPTTIGSKTIAGTQLGLLKTRKRVNAALNDPFYAQIGVNPCTVQYLVKFSNRAIIFCLVGSSAFHRS